MHFCKTHRPSPPHTWLQSKSDINSWKWLANACYVAEFGTYVPYVYIGRAWHKIWALIKYAVPTITMRVHNKLSINNSSIGPLWRPFTAVKVWQNTVDNRPYTGYSSQSSKHPPVRYTVPVLRCRTYGSYGLRLTPLMPSDFLGLPFLSWRRMSGL